MDDYMREAIQEAQKGFSENGIPIGAVLVKNGQIIGRGHNKRIQNNNPILHAEVDCFQNCGRIGSFKGAILYSTLMPCYLCAGAVVQFNIKRVVVGESKNFTGAKEFMESHGIEVIDLDLDECKKMMEKFIQNHFDIWSEDIGKS